MTNSEAKKFVESIYKDIWAAKDLTKFDKYYNKNLESVAYLPGEELFFNYDSLKKFAHEAAKNRYNVETEFDEIIGQKNKIFVKYRQKSISRITNKVIYTRVAFGYELVNDKIHKTWAISNASWGW